MKTLRSLCFLLLSFLSACGHSQHGLRIYTPTKSTDAKGNTRGGSALLLSANADMPGVKSIKAGEVDIQFNDINVQTSTVLVNAKGEVIGTNTGAVVAGLYTSEVTRAQGEADKSRIKETAAGVTGAALSFAAPAIAGGLSGGVTSVANAVKP